VDFNFLLPIAGFAVGLIVGMTGVGGGSLMTPALIFGLGVSPAVAVGTDLIFAGATKPVGVWTHRAAGNIDWRLMRLLAMGSLPATIVSILLLDRIGSRELLDTAVLPVLGVALLLTAMALILKTRFVRIAEGFARRSGEPSAMWIALSGAVLGGLVTLSSVGAGALGVTVLMFCRPNMPSKRIVGTNLAHALPLALVAGIGHWHLGTVDFSLLGALLVGSLPGIYIGSSLTGKVPEPVLRGLLAAVLLTAGITCFVMR
jgi:uncharacterized membrane protein YfcA